MISANLVETLLWPALVPRAQNLVTSVEIFTTFIIADRLTDVHIRFPQELVAELGREKKRQLFHFLVEDDQFIVLLVLGRWSHLPSQRECTGFQ
jgi:hypothetical protein